MSRTYRKDYAGHKQRDGSYLKRCPEANCNVCGTGYMKRVLRRLARLFDRWLAQVKAEAWDEGWDDGASWPQPEKWTNPYREETE